MDYEILRALEEDGKKLQALTGEAHGPYYLGGAFDDGYSAGWSDGFQDGLESIRFIGMVEDVREFHKVCGTIDPDKPTWPVFEKRVLRTRLQEEETEELLQELNPEKYGEGPYDGIGGKEHLAALAKEIVDVIYVAIGTAITCGIPLEKVWAEVHKSNMAKVDPATGMVRRRADGKVLKPQGWKKPDVVGAMFDA